MREKMNSVKQEREYIDAEMVAEYLRLHPAFFTQHVDLIDTLKFNLEQRGTVSLVDIQLTKLRNKVSELESEITTLMEVGTRNDRLFQVISQAQIQLLTATNIMEAQAVIDTLCMDLDLVGKICLFDHDNLFFRLDKRSYQLLKQAHFESQNKFLGRLKKSESKIFFEHGIDLGSVALIPIGQHFNRGVLAFSSFDGGHFQPNMDTLFLEQLARIISLRLDKWK